MSKLKIGIYDGSWSYNIDTPYNEALGGTQSAICYFAEEMAKKDDVYLFTKIENEITIRNVIHTPANKITNMNFDVFIVSCLANDLLEIKLKLNNPNTLFCLWTGHDVDQNASEILNNKLHMEFVDLYMFVSDWQRCRYIEKFNIPYNKTLIMRNGIAKPFEEYLTKPLKKVKNSMTYCSIPWRGLELMIPIFKQLREIRKNATFKIFSGMNIYKQEDNNKYEEFKNMEGVIYNEGISQKELASELFKIEYLSYPCIFKETSCITALQAMACGCIVVTSELGALRETMNGLNKYVPINQYEFNTNKYIVDYVNEFKNVFNLSEEIKQKLRDDNRRHIKENYTWSKICKTFRDDIIKVIEEKINYNKNFEKIISETLDLYNNKEWIGFLKNGNQIKYYQNPTLFHMLKINLAVSYYSIKNYKKAKENFKIAKNILNDFNVNKNLALLELEVGNKQNFYRYGKEALLQHFDPLFATLMAEKYDSDNIYHESISLYESILMIDPNNIVATNNLGNMYLFFLPNMESIDVMMEKSYMKSHDISIVMNDYRKKELVYSNWIFNNLYNWNLSEEEIFRRASTWSNAFPKLENFIKIANKLDRKKKHNNIRIGYISTDFITHPVGYMFDSILKNHDLNSFEIFCYDNASVKPEENETAIKLRGYNNAKWLRITDMKDEYILQNMIDDDLDIMVDMMGHTRNTRIHLLQYKPAKVQISYFAYPGTNGIPEVDYKLTDKYATPEWTQKYFVEKLYYLPNGFQCYTPPRELPAIKRYNRDAKYSINLCCFNNPIKLSIPTIKLFANVLKCLPEAKLYLRYVFYRSSLMRENMYKLFENEGIERERIDIAHYDLIKCLDFYNDMDIALDPFPYNGGTITSECLYMNTPIITLEGTNYVSRVGVSLLSNLGLEKYIAKDKEEYVQKVIDLARNQDELKELHKTIRDKMLNSDLADSVKFTNNIENAFKDMMEIYWQKN